MKPTTHVSYLIGNVTYTVKNKLVKSNTKKVLKSCLPGCNFDKNLIRIHLQFDCQGAFNTEYVMKLQQFSDKVTKKLLLSYSSYFV